MGKFHLLCCILHFTIAFWTVFLPIIPCHIYYSIEQNSYRKTVEVEVLRNCPFLDPLPSEIKKLFFYKIAYLHLYLYDYIQRWK